MKNKKFLFLFLILGFIFFPRNTYALNREARLYILSNNDTSISRYLTINNSQINYGQGITHQGGTYPNAIGFSYDDYTFSSRNRYIVTTNFTIRLTNTLSYRNKYNTRDSFNNVNDRMGELTISQNSYKHPNSSTYEYNYTFTSDFKPSPDSNYLLQMAWFSENRQVTYLKVNNYTITPVNSTDNGDVINNNNQNTQNIINNNNENTQNIINSQNDTTNAVNDLNDTLKDTEIDDSIGDNFTEIDEVSKTPITDLIGLPVTFLHEISNYAHRQSCTNLRLPFGLTGGSEEVVIPCFDGEKYFGNLWYLMDSMISIFLFLNIGMMCITFFEKVTSLEDVFDSMYEPRHEYTGYKPKHGGGN